VRRPFIALVVSVAAIGLFTAGLAFLLDTPRVRPGASRAERIFQGLCATCHGQDGRGSWRAALFMIHPGNLAEGAQVKHDSDQYLFDIIKNGGAPIGRPGMPAFGSQLTDEDMHALVAYVRSLGIARDAPLR
jgi:mono/diheme cytochrome c family protein